MSRTLKLRIESAVMISFNVITYYMKSEFILLVRCIIIMIITSILYRKVSFVQVHVSSLLEPMRVRLSLTRSIMDHMKAKELIISIITALI